MTLRAIEDWCPPTPAEQDGFDWIQVKSGEWLKGWIKSLQSLALLFQTRFDIALTSAGRLQAHYRPRILFLNQQTHNPIGILT